MKRVYLLFSLVFIACGPAEIGGGTGGGDGATGGNQATGGQGTGGSQATGGGEGTGGGEATGGGQGTGGGEATGGGEGTGGGGNGYDGGTPANSALLTWVAPTTNTDGTPLTDLGGFKVKRGTVAGVYTQVIDVGNVVTYQLTGLASGTHYFVVTAYDTSGNESMASNQVSKNVP